MCCFFKQKTAYEMRISDWSSGVCSSELNDLAEFLGAGAGEHHRHQAGKVQRLFGADTAVAEGAFFRAERALRRGVVQIDGVRVQHFELHHAQRVVRPRLLHHRRSEEHTSELPSLMRTSYAVFCLKKK